MSMFTRWRHQLTPPAATDGADPAPDSPETAAHVGDFARATDPAPGAEAPTEARPDPTRRPGGVRRTAAAVTTVLATLLVWFALVAPDEISRLTPAAFLRIPVEGLAILALVVVLPRRARWIVAAAIGLLLGVITVAKIVDMGFFEAINRPFSPAADWPYFASAEGLLAVSIGQTAAVAFLTTAAVVGVAVVVFTPFAAVRLARLTAAHRTTSLRTAGAFGVVWVLCAVFGVQFAAGAPVASSSAAGIAYSEAHQLYAGFTDRAALVKAAADDPFRSTSAADLLTGLRGKDVVIAFVESYGRVAVQGSTFSPPIDAILRDGTSQLRAAGYNSRSAFLTSPTFGGISWLAHSTLQAGLRIDNQPRYNDLITTDRFTLSDAFKRAGWRTVADVPSNEKDWPEGQTFYHYDTIYDGHNVGYQGPRFSYAAMPDQYTMAAFQRLELGPGHPPMMAEIDLVSSHTPWAPLPRMVDWNAVGDGSIYNPMPAQGQSPTTVWRDANQVRAAYGQSIQYSLTTLITFMQHTTDKNLVLILLGDHQPATIVSGQGADHDVPITIIARDPAVTARIASWGW